MALITTLTTLQSAVADTFNRTNDSTFQDSCNVWVQLAEQRFQRDPRVREPGSNNSVLTGLGTTGANSNWLLLAEPDIYLYAVLVEGALFYKDYERVPEFEAALESRIDKLSGSVRLDPNRTALALATYANLQTTVADALNRGDLKNVVPLLVTLAEARLSTDNRCRSLVRAAYNVTSDNLAVPEGFRTLESFYHDSTTYNTPIEIVGADVIGTLKSRYGTSGVPRYAAVINGNFIFAPAPDTTYATRIVYWRTITALSAGVNWLYTGHPHIYLHATVAQAGPWVRGDMRAEQTVAEFAALLENDLNLLNNEVWDDQWAGGTMRRQFWAIG